MCPCTATAAPMKSLFTLDCTPFVWRLLGDTATIKHWFFTLADSLFVAISRRWYSDCTDTGSDSSLLIHHCVVVYNTSQSSWVILEASSINATGILIVKHSSLILPCYLKEVAAVTLWFVLIQTDSAVIVAKWLCWWFNIVHRCCIVASLLQSDEKHDSASFRYLLHIIIPFS